VWTFSDKYYSFNAPKGGNADLTLHYKYFNQSEQKFTGRSPRRCAPRDDGLAPKGGNAVLTQEIEVWTFSDKYYSFNAPKGGNAVLTVSGKKG